MNTKQRKRVMALQGQWYNVLPNNIYSFFKYRFIRLITFKKKNPTIYIFKFKIEMCHIMVKRKGKN